MPKQISANIGGNTLTYSIYIPEACPVCGVSIEPKITTTHGIAEGGPNNKGARPTALDVLIVCPREECQHAFLCMYIRNDPDQNPASAGYWTFTGCAPLVFRAIKFDERIGKLSSLFSIIFNQAAHAESLGLNHICGPGYRKSLEFLVKDYLCSRLHSDTERERIKHKFLGACISEDVDDPRIKSMAQRATWLGNDETHYVRKWDTKDVSDLKKLIELTVHWIETELITEELEASMPK